MIVGSFSSDRNASLSINHLLKSANFQDVIFHKVYSEGFSGGFYLNPRLPWKPSDFYYFDEVNDIQVLLSGSVYNKSELLLLYNINTPIADPEMIAQLYLQEGPGFVNKLNGDFAFFIGQPSRKKAYLFRDHVGIRPLAYTIDGQSICFSSDIIGLCRAFSDGQPVVRDYLMDYFKYIDYRRTPNMKVSKLLPGHYLDISVNKIELKKYWEPEKIRIENKLEYDKMLTDLKNLVQDAVKIRCDQRFIAGAHVTGGIDSGIVSTLARKEFFHQDNFYGFSWSPEYFPEGHIKFDERELALKTCEKAAMRPIFSKMNHAAFQRFISDFFL